MESTKNEKNDKIRHDLKDDQERPTNQNLDSIDPSEGVFELKDRRKGREISTNGDTDLCDLISPKVEI